MVVLLATSALRADTLHWVNAAGGSYFEPTNWDLGRVPGTVDTIVFDLDAAYSVVLGGAVDSTVNRLEVLQGTVTFQGARTLFVFPGAAGSGIVVGNGVGGVLRLESLVYTAGQPLDIQPQGSLVIRSGGTYFSAAGELRVAAGATLRIEGGLSSPATLRFNGGRGIVTSGTMSGQNVTMIAGSDVDASGAGSVFTSEQFLHLEGTVTIRDGARLGPAVPSTPYSLSASACNLTLSNGGNASTGPIHTDAASVVTLQGGAVWRSHSASEFRGALVARAGADVQLNGHFFSTLDVDQAAVVSRGSLVLDGGLTVEIDGLVQPPTPIVPAGVLESDTSITGPLTVRVRNANALRAGDVYPIFGHEAGSAQAFSTLVAPAIGGGRVLQMVRSGSPAVTRVQVAMGPPSCFPDADFDGDGDGATDADIEAFFACLAGTCCATCASADFDGDGDVGTSADIEAFFDVLGGRPC
jgi:hypothetical protein